MGVLEFMLKYQGCIRHTFVWADTAGRFVSIDGPYCQALRTGRVMSNHTGFRRFDLKTLFDLPVLLSDGEATTPERTLNLSPRPRLILLPQTTPKTPPITPSTSHPPLQPPQTHLV